MTQVEIEQMLANPGPIALHTVLDRALDAGLKSPRLSLAPLDDGLIVTLTADDPSVGVGIIFLDSKQVASGATWAPAIASMYKAIRVWELAQK